MGKEVTGTTHQRDTQSTFEETLRSSASSMGCQRRPHDHHGPTLRIHVSLKTRTSVEDIIVLRCVHLMTFQESCQTPIANFASNTYKRRRGQVYHPAGGPAATATNTNRLMRTQMQDVGLPHPLSFPTPDLRWPLVVNRIWGDPRLPGLRSSVVQQMQIHAAL